MQYWYKRLSCTLQKGNARAISARILDITQSAASQYDECFDEMNDNEYNNIDTITSFRSYLFIVLILIIYAIQIFYSW